MPKTVLLLSGGLDSTLAARVMLEQNVEIHAINFASVFCTCTPKGAGCSAANSAARQLGIPLRTESNSEELIPLVKSPRHGYGRNLNPCLDCRILSFKKAKRYMDEIGADFLTTGEVLGERPMSQRMDAMRIIERDAGVAGLVLRPLSARLMPVTEPEAKGLVDREKLLAIEGRSRKEQMGLAEHYGIKDYPCPAGGCLLTDEGFARRMKDLMAFEPDFGVHDCILLKVGRHFRLSPQAKLIVGREEAQNARLVELGRPGDWLLVPTTTPGATGLLRGAPTGQEGTLRLAASIVAHYGKGRNAPAVELEVRRLEAGRAATDTIQTAAVAELPQSL
ncbi:MAG: hypothetical protein RDV41_11040 [Planctomycetota bacterium]|nr:hypothetical protein [Planctomycetota bacterium]